MGNFSNIQKIPPTTPTPVWIYVVPSVLGTTAFILFVVVSVYVATKILMHQKIVEREENWKGVENAGESPVNGEKKIEIV